MHFCSMSIVLVTGCIVHQAISSELKKLALPSSSKGQFLNRTLELLEVMGADATYDATTKMVLDSYGAVLGSLKTKLEQFITQCCSYSALKYDLAEIYMQEFTLNNINQLIRFYSSPLGKKFGQKRPVLMAKVKELGERKVREQLPKLQAMIQQELGKGGSINQGY